MTTLVNFRKNLLAVLCISAMLLSFGACKETPKAADTEEVAEDMNKPKDDMSKERDEEFMMKVAEHNLEEIALGQLAVQKATDPDVKSFGQMMVDAHTKAQSELTALAAKKSIAVPMAATQDVQDAVKNMSDKTGLDFDKDFSDRMVRGHKDAIDKFENMANNDNSDAEIKAWASSMLPTLRTHLQQAEAIQKKIAEMK